MMMMMMMTMLRGDKCHYYIF